MADEATTKSEPRLEFHHLASTGDLTYGARMMPDGAIHIAVVKAAGVRPSFYELMAIKAMVAGAESQAVEIYPADSQLVDQGGNSATHLWVLPTNRRLPYALPK